MDEELFKTNMNTMKEIVLDEEKLVTYYSLSKDLCIHVNDSKKLMASFVDEMKSNQPNLKFQLQFIISGLSKDDKAKTIVCSEKDIAKEKSDLKIVFFEHIYSLCKGLSKVDKVALLSLSKFEDFPLCTGLIKSDICMKHTSHEIDRLKSSSQEAAVKVQKNTLPKPKKTLENNNTGKNQSESNPIKIIHETKSEPVINTESISPKKETVKNIQKSESNKNGKKTQKGIAGFFNKSNSDPVKKEQKDAVVKTKNMKEVKEPPVKEEKMDLDEDIEVEKVDKSISNKAVSKLSQIKKNAKVDKKRKRLLRVSDSDSEEEKNDAPSVNEEKLDSDDEIPPTPTINTVKVTSGMLNPKKKRKIVDKTYMDDEGYIHTKKEEVYESCSDNEEPQKTEDAKENIRHNLKTEVSPKGKTTSKNGKKKPSPPQKGKQATLTNFFKRKE